MHANSVDSHFAPVSADSKASTARVFDIQFELRSLPQYVDMALSATPITVTVPIIDKSDREFMAACFPDRLSHLRVGGTVASTASILLPEFRFFCQFSSSGFFSRFFKNAKHSLALAYLIPTCKP
jgi:hypothetical protein